MMEKRLTDCITQDECYERQNYCRATTRGLIYTASGILLPLVFALFGYLYLQGRAQAEQDAVQSSFIENNTAKIERVYIMLDKMDDKLDDLIIAKQR
jgi:hypothetical protein